jgi:hypothetical protein
MFWQSYKVIASPRRFRNPWELKVLEVAAEREGPLGCDRVKEHAWFGLAAEKALRARAVPPVRATRVEGADPMPRGGRGGRNTGAGASTRTGNTGGQRRRRGNRPCAPGSNDAPANLIKKELMRSRVKAEQAPQNDLSPTDALELSGDESQRPGNDDSESVPDMHELFGSESSLADSGTEGAPEGSDVAVGGGLLFPSVVARQQLTADMRAGNDLTRQHETERERAIRLANIAAHEACMKINAEILRSNKPAPQEPEQNPSEQPPQQEPTEDPDPPGTPNVHDYPLYPGPLPAENENANSRATVVAAAAARAVRAIQKSRARQEKRMQRRKLLMGTQRMKMKQGERDLGGKGRTKRTVTKRLQ